MTTAAKEIVMKLKNAGHEAVFAGGCVRDMFLGLPAKDIDIATSATPDEVEALFNHTIPVGKQFGIIVVLYKNYEFEVATFRTDSKESDGRRPNSVEFSSIKEDALRRDLTINGLFWDPIEEKVFDFVGGEEDINHEIIQFIGDAQDRIDEDRLRMLRAVRFTAKLNFNMADNVMDALRKNAHRISDVSAERIKDEMDKMLKISKPSIALNLLRESGLLKHFLPEVDALFGCKQSARWHAEGSKVRKIFLDENDRYKLGPIEEFDNKNPEHRDKEKFKVVEHGDVWTHTMLVLDNIRKQTSELEVLWAALLHDIGKPSTAGLNDHGDINNHGHDKVGAKMAREVMNRMRASTKEKETIVAVVKDHMKVHVAKNMKKSKLRRFVAQDHFEALLVVASADSNSSWPRDEEDRKLRKEDSSFLREFVIKLDNEGGKKLPKPFVTGHDLIGFGLKPGPMFKELLKKVADKQLEGEIVNKDEALAFVKTLI